MNNTEPYPDETVTAWPNDRGLWYATVTSNRPWRLRPLATAAILNGINEQPGLRVLPHAVGVREMFDASKKSQMFVETTPLHGLPMTGVDWDDLFAGFVGASLWTGTYWSGNDDDEPEELDQHVEAPDDLPDDVICKMVTVLHDFITRITMLHPHELEAYLRTFDSISLGHDFALTREGHGAGFWDRGLGETGDVLTSAAECHRGEGLSAGPAGGGLGIDFS